MSRILIVDDRPTNREYLVTLLRYQGHDVHEAGDGEEALRAARADPPDLIVSDIVMPRMDGVALVAALRADPALARIPVVFATATFRWRGARDLARVAGVRWVLAKPVEPETMLATVREALGEIPGVAAAREKARPALDSTTLLRMASESQVATARLAALVELGVEMAGQGDAQGLVERFCDAARGILGSEYAVLGILGDGNDDALRLFTAWRGSRRYDEMPRPRARSGVFGRILDERRPVRFSNPGGDPVEAGLPPEHPPVRSFLGVPIGTRSKTLGWLYLANATADAGFTEEDERIAATIAIQTAVAYENVRLREEARARTVVLEQSEERFRQIAESIREAFWLLDAKDGAVLYASPATAEIWGRPASDLSTLEAWLSTIHAEDRERMAAESVPGRHGLTHDWTYRILRPDGAVRWIRDRAFPVADATGAVVRIAGIAEDITDLKRTEEKLYQAMKMEAVGRLAGGVAHDFNNLLSVIIGYSDLALQKCRGDSGLSNYVGEVRKAGDKAANLVEQLLTFSRKSVASPRVIDLNAVVKDMETMLRRLIGEDLELKAVLAPDLGPVRIDPTQMEQIVMNLAVNARDAMPDGGTLTLETANVEVGAEDIGGGARLAPGRYCLFAVSDTGTGMDEATMARIFEPFFTTKEEGKGTGLGLATVYGIVEGAGGGLSVYSEPGKGSTFKVYLPRRDSAVDEAAARTAESPIPGGKETILVVEDNDQVRGLSVEVLRELGYRVIEAATPSVALAAAEAEGQAIDLVVTDVVMPEMGGGVLASRLQAHCPRMRVLFVSGYTAGAVGLHRIPEKGLHFLAKPFSPEALARRVREVLDEPAGAPRP